MEVRLLGPVRLVVDGETVPLGPKERALLAALALRPGQRVSTDHLVEVVWGEDPPPSADRSLRSHLSRLRSALGDAGSALTSGGGGYRLDTPAGSVDATRVETMIGDARDRLAAGDVAGAAEVLREALAAWDGPSLGELAEQAWATGDAARLDELRLCATEDRVEADLACGRHAELVGELEAATATHPYRERMWAARVTALYRAGRQAEALRALGDLRDILAEDLGLDPSPPLLALERQVLDHDPALLGSFPTATARLPSGLVAFLLTDVVGSTRLWEDHPAEMVAALERHDRLIGDAVAAAGGTLLKSRGEGDATFSVFTKASQAARAAAAAQRALAGEPRVMVRMAVHVGEAVERGGDYFGPTVNRAARLRGLAGGGEVLLSRSAAELVLDEAGQSPALVEVGERHLKDLSRPETVYRLVLDDGMSASRPQSPPEILEEDERVVLDLPLPSSLAVTELVGREATVATMVAAWDEVEHGARRAILVAGEPGIGKSALAAHVAELVHDRGGLVLHGRCDEGLHVVFQPFAEALRPVVDAVGPRALSSLPGAGELVRLFPDLATTVPDLPAPVRADADAERWALFQAVTGLLALATDARPVLLVVDDLHWSAGPSLQLLRHLLRSDRSHLLVVGTYRHTDIDRADDLADLLADLRREPGVDRLLLDGLDETGMHELIERRAGEPLGDAARALARLLHAETAGNPFFAIEVLRHLVESGAVYRSDAGRWTSDFTIDAIGLPESVREVVGRRLSRLSEPTQQALRVAAVVGSSFSLKLLEVIPDAGEEPDDVLDAMDEAVGAGLLVEKRGGYEFGHSLIRQTLLDQLSSTRRIRLHRRIGEAIESLGPPASHLEALARHFAEAAYEGQAAKAADYALAAARQASDRAAPEQAAALLRRGIEALDTEADVDLLRRADLSLELAILGYASPGGSRQGVLQVLDLAIEDARRARAGYQLVQGIALRLLGSGVSQRHEPDLGPLVDEATEMLDPADAEGRAVLAAIRVLQSTQSPAGSLDAAERAIAEARRVGGEEVLTLALEAAVAVLLAEPLPDQLLAVGDELLEAAPSERQFTARTIGLGARATALITGGQVDEFRRMVADVHDLARSRRSWYAVYNAFAYDGSLALLEGRWDDAEQSAAALLEHGGGDVDAFNVWAAQHGVLHHQKGTLDSFRPAMELAVEATPRIVAFRAGVALAHLEAGRPEVAREQLAEAMAALPEVAHDQLWPVTIAVLADVASGVGALDAGGELDAARELDQLLSPWKGLLIASAGGTFCWASADQLRGQLALAFGRTDDAIDRLRAALGLAERIGSPPFAARARLWLGRALLDRDAGAAREALREAIAIAEPLDMAGVIRDAERHLADSGESPPMPLPSNWR